MPYAHIAASKGVQIALHTWLTFPQIHALWVYMTFGCNRSRIQPGSGSSLLYCKWPRMCFAGIPLPMARQMRNGPNSSVFHQGRGDMYTHQLKLVMWTWQAAAVVLQMGGYVVERLRLWRGTYWESNRETFIEYPMFVHVRSFCPPTLSSGTALQQDFSRDQNT